MRAIVCTKYGSPPDVVRVQEIDKPSPKDNEVLVKVHAASVNALDWRLFTLPRVVVKVVGLLSGIGSSKDKSLGADFAGRVEAIGPGVTQFRVGDDVFGSTRGSFREYVCAAETRMVRKPAAVSFEAAAAVPVAGLTALQAVRHHANIQPGQKVLINGAGGGIGTFAVQIAKASGAEVTAVCSTRNQDVARSIGADHVIDYQREDCTRSGRRYDVVIAVNGYHSLLAYRRILNRGGTYVVLGGSLWQMFQQLVFGPVLSRLGPEKFLGMMTRPSQNDLVALQELLESGKVVPVIDRRYPLGEVAAAISYLIEGHSSGKVIITFSA